jgi:hypothetical protein
MSLTDNALVSSTHSFFLSSTIDITPASSFCSEWGEKVQVSIPFKAPLLYRLYLVFDLSDECQLRGWAALCNIVLKCIDQVGISINTHQVQEFGAVSLLHELYTSTPEHAVRSQTDASPDSIALPLPFWFSKRRTSALQLFMLPAHDVALSVGLREEEAEGRERLSRIFRSCRVFAEYIFTTDLELDWMRRNMPRLDLMLSKHTIRPITSTWSWNPEFQLDPITNLPVNLEETITRAPWLMRTSVRIVLSDALPSKIIRDIRWTALPAGATDAFPSFQQLPVTGSGPFKVSLTTHRSLVSIESVDLVLNDSPAGSLVSQDIPQQARLCDTIFPYFKSKTHLRLDVMQSDFVLPTFAYSFAFQPSSTDNMYSGALNLKRLTHGAVVLRINYVIYPDPDMLANIETATSIEELFSPWSWTPALVTHVFLNYYTTTEIAHAGFKHWIEG